MTELETIQRAKMYMDKLAKGINPIRDNAVDSLQIIDKPAKWSGSNWQVSLCRAVLHTPKEES